MDEEVVLLEEQLAAAQGDIERFQSRLADVEARYSEREAELNDLKRRLAERDESLSAQSQQVAALELSLEQVRGEAREAVARYREAVLQQESDLPADLVTGETVSEVEASLAEARRTVAQVRQHLEQRAQSLRVPAGAPVRSAPDASEMTAAEKIRHGLNQG